MEVTDPAAPLFGKRFRLDSRARSTSETAYVFLRREDGVVLRVPRRSTSLSILVGHAPQAKLSPQSVTEFLSLVKEYELCRHPEKSRPGKSGRRSTSKRDKKS